MVLHIIHRPKKFLWPLYKKNYHLFNVRERKQYTLNAWINIENAHAFNKVNCTPRMLLKQTNLPVEKPNILCCFMFLCLHYCSPWCQNLSAPLPQLLHFHNETQVTHYFLASITFNFIIPLVPEPLFWILTLDRRNYFLSISYVANPSN